MNHNSLGCEQLSRPRCRTITQCAGRVSANTRPLQLRWGDWECGCFTLSMNAGDCVVCMSSLYAYMYVHAHVCVSIYMYNTYVHGCSCLYYMYGCMYVHVYALYVCAYVLYSTCIHKCVSVCRCTTAWVL